MYARNPLREKLSPLSRDKVLALLPKVGDERMEYPTIDETQSISGSETAQRCVVVAVYPDRLWYTVQFENGIRESYKVPKCESTNGGPAR